MRKSILSVLIVLCLVLTLAPMNIFAEGTGDSTATVVVGNLDFTSYDDLVSKLGDTGYAEVSQNTETGVITVKLLQNINGRLYIASGYNGADIIFDANGMTIDGNGQNEAICIDNGCQASVTLTGNGIYLPGLNNLIYMGGRGELIIQSGKFKGEITSSNHITITGGLYAQSWGTDVVQDGYLCVDNTDPNTKDDYPYTIVTHTHEFDQEVVKMEYRKGDLLFYKSCVCGKSSQGCAEEATFTIPEHQPHADNPSVQWQLWHGESITTPGSYYLECDAEKDAITISADANICLNGKVLTSSGFSNISISDGVNVTICDCGSGGTIIGKWETIKNGNNSVLTIQGGDIACEGQRTIINTNGTINMHGGSISCEGLNTIINGGNGIINIYGGDISCNGLATIINNDNGTINIYGGTVTDTFLQSIDNAGTGTVNVSGGAVRAIRNSGQGIVSLSGGTYGVKGDDAWLADGYEWRINNDSSTKDAYPYAVKEIHEHIYNMETVDDIYLKSAADCENAKIYYKSCNVCGESSKDTANEGTFTSGVALGHSGGTATCKVLAVCTTCGASYGELSTTHGETEVRGAASATCTEEGYTGDTYCKVCDNKIAGGSKINADGHDYSSRVTKEPSVSEEGERTYTCDTCGHSYTEPIAKLEPGSTSTPSATAVPTPTTAPTQTPTATPTQVPTAETTEAPSTAPTQTSRDPGLPFIKEDAGKIGWEAIRGETAKAKEGDTIVVEMNGTTEVPGEVFDDIKGKDINITLNMGNNISWTINGKNITDDKVNDINFEVRVGTKENPINIIPVGVINKLTGERYFVNISLVHDGDLGLKAILNINLDAKNAGLFANLFYYNEQYGVLQFIWADDIDEHGVAHLVFSHASEYTIVMDEGIMQNSITSPKTGEENKELPAGLLVCALLSISMGSFFIARKRKKV